MKLTKFIASVALIASTSLVSGAHAVPVGVEQETKAYCTNWPYCRGEGIADQTADQQQHLKMEAVLKAV